MGMSIDKAIAKIWHCIVSIRDCTGNKEFVEALELSVDTMRKYQKIVQIMERTVDDGTSMYDTLQEIEEVVEDGNID
jgi:hypothetical protein